MNQLEPPYPLILERLRRGQVIPFLGSAASLGERSLDAEQSRYLPTADELAKHLADKILFPADEQRDLAKVAQYFHVVAGRQTLRQELHYIFDHDYPLTPLHEFLVDVPVPQLIITTNYDDLIERAFSAKGIAYDVVVHTTEPDAGHLLLWWPHGQPSPKEIASNKLDIDLDEVTVIYKIHGAVNRHERKRDQFVITEDDYVDFLTRITKNKVIPAIFAEPFLQRNFLFLGYGLRDWNLRVVLNRIAQELGRPKEITSWAIQYRVSPMEQRFWQARGVEVYNMTIAEFIQKLMSR